MEEPHAGIRVEYCHPVDGAASKGSVILINDGDYSIEEMEVLFELGMMRYQRQFGEVLFRPKEIGFPQLVPPPGVAPVVPQLRLVQDPPTDFHRMIGIRLAHGARDNIHPSAAALAEKLETMIDEDRMNRFGLHTQTFAH